MTHSELVRIGSKWLKKHKQNVIIPNCSLVISEQVANTSYGEIPDIYGLCSWTSVLIEVKVSRADFIADFNKRFRKDPDKGIGELRYFLCPYGTIKVDDLPNHWGLLYYRDDGKIEIIHKATKQPAHLDSERSILFATINRMK